MQIRISIGDRWKQMTGKAGRLGSLDWKGSERLRLLCRKPEILAFLLMAAILSAASIQNAQAQMLGQYIESYTARLSPRDHYNSNGERLQSAAAIIRQDRANFYVYGLRDSEDEPDSFFSKKSNRARLEQLLENGRTTPDAIHRIVNGTPLIKVDIYATGIVVTILSD